MNIVSQTSSSSPPTFITLVVVCSSQFAFFSPKEGGDEEEGLFVPFPTSLNIKPNILSLMCGVSGVVVIVHLCSNIVSTPKTYEATANILVIVITSAAVLVERVPTPPPHLLPSRAVSLSDNIKKTDSGLRILSPKSCRRHHQHLSHSWSSAAHSSISSPQRKKETKKKDYLSHFQPL
mgnify:CR=1 FL=1